MTDQQLTPREVLHVRRMAARIRRMLATAPAGVPRGQLRNKLNSREKYLFDTAVGLLIAVGDVVIEPAAQAGTRYRLTEQAGVVPASDSETNHSTTSNNA